MSKGSVIPVIAFTILNVVFLMDEGLSGFGFVVLLFIANGVLFTPSAFAWRKRSGVMNASLVCPYCRSELPDETVSVCSKCGKSIKFVDGDNPAFVKADASFTDKGDVSGRLMKLKALKDADILTEEEYEKKRAELVAEL